MKVTLIRLDNGQPFVSTATLETNADGSVSFRLPSGHYVGQNPVGYGLREDGPNTQQYQRAMLSGSVVTFVPHPDYPPYAYLIGQGRVYPA